jgi:hypothetical protein
MTQPKAPKLQTKFPKQSAEHKKHQSILQDITRALEKFINDEIAKCKEPPTQKITTECLEALKMNF